ncbi:helix-turn-helix domain-containing protein [Bradyrhizobium sp. 35]|uniref:helix-turn-helix domain-containing protein n=1 Tax=Bradyrhizobium sp. 35 TaxID=2782670 RepID=UPI001FFAB391|nr:helix-turn-helix domain-containing protein [Bradyrhizobium sp. 35]MCK1453380.1 helix-turn-helix domain-containing protein [Bradyrhizobium sp. 35]
MKTPKQIATAASDRLAFTIEEAAKASSLGSTSIYKAIRDRQLVARKYGTRTIITKTELDAFLNNLPPVVGE